MPVIVRIPRSPRSRWMAIGGLAGAATLALAACGSTSSKTSATTVAPLTTVAASPTTTTPAGITVKSANVTGVGTVLVNGQGLTLYLLTSETGGKVTCTDDNGCTKVWPDNELPDGVTAATPGAGIDASKLGTTKGTSGDSYVTYAGFPLYTFSHDSGPGTANGEGIKSFGGTWEAITPAGTPVLPAAAGAAATTTTAY